MANDSNEFPSFDLGAVAKEKQVKVVELSQLLHLIPGQFREVPVIDEYFSS